MTDPKDRPKTQPRLKAIKPVSAETPPPLPNDVSVAFTAKGLNLKLGQNAAATFAKWVFRVLVLAFLGFLTLDRVQGPEKATKSIEGRVEKLEGYMIKLLVKFDIPVEP